MGEIDLHPFVTVVTGLDEVAGRRLIGAVRAVVAGEDPGVPGLVQSQGLLIELSAGVGLAPAGPPITDVVLDLDRALAESDDRRGQRNLLEQVERSASVAALRLEEARADLDLGAAAELHRLQATRRARPVEPVPTAEVRQAFERWLAAPVMVSEPAPWAAELLERWESCRQRGRELEGHRRGLDRRLEEAEHELALAVDGLARAREAAQPRLLGPAEEERLAELAVGSVERRGLRARVRRRDEEQTELEALLAKVGQPTYAAYMLYRVAPTPERQAIEAVVEAERALTRAEAARDEAAAARAESTELHVQARWEADLRVEVQRRLGRADLPDELAPILARCTEEVPNPERIRARDLLVRELTATGFAVAADEGDEALADRVGAWLATAPPPEPVEDRAAEELVAERLARHRQALARLDRLEDELAERRREIIELRAQVVERDRGRAAPQRLLQAVRARIEALAVDDDGGTPLVLTGELTELAPGEVARLLDGLEPLTHRVQLVLVTDHPEARRWADDAGLARALRSGAATV